MRNSFIIALTIFVLSRKSLSETVLLDNEDDAPSAEGFHGYSNNLDLAEFNTSNIESLVIFSF